QNFVCFRKTMKQNPTTPLAKALLSNKEIKRALMLKQVEDICLSEGLIIQRDIDTKSKYWRWVADIVDNHLVCSALLKHIMCKHTDQYDQSELFNSIIRDIVERVMSQQSPFPKRQ
ncbi:hypothetical protein AB6C72_25930, partial [Vibrio splendidus]